MDNISQFLTNSLKASFNQIQTKLNAELSVPDSIWKVFRKHTNESDYCFAGSYNISKITNDSVENIQNELVKYFPMECKNNFIISIYKRDINFKLSDEYLNKLLLNGLNCSTLIKKTDNPQNILVDFSSPNVAKDLHVGHLRSTIIGDTISILFEKLGHNVSRVNHIGDFGTQFGMLVQHLLESNPDFENNPPDIKNLQQFYVEAKKRFDTEPEFKKKSHEKTVILQQNNLYDNNINNNVVGGWRLICDISRKSYNEIYKKLNVTLAECGESFYQQMLPNIVKELEDKGLVTESDGAKVMHVNNSQFPLILVKSDGGFTYDTTDLAAIKYRLKVLKMDKIFYVVDSGQSSHFDMIFAAAKKAGWYDPTIHTVKHIGFGLVLGEDGKRMKSRDGGTIPLTELLDKAIETAENSIKNRLSDPGIIKKYGENYMNENEINEAIPSIAYGAIKYTDLSNTRTNNYKFSFDKMLELKGNTVVYQLYSYARMNGIINKLTSSEHFIPESFSVFSFNDKSERDLCTKIVQFPEIINDIESSILPHKLCSYLYELSDSVQKFYHNCRCVNFEEDKTTIKNINMSRAMLCILAFKIQKEIFSLLNIQTLNKI